MSEAMSFHEGLLSANEIEMHPDPTPTSRTIAPALLKGNFKTTSTMSSVSGLGISTLESTKKVWLKNEDSFKI